MAPTPPDTSPDRASRPPRRHLVDVVLLAAAVSLACFAILRAARVALTYDEAASYLRYLAADPFSVFDFQVATNHLLYTALARVSTSVGGPGEIALRAPSLAGLAVYLFASWSIVRRLSSPLLQVAGFLLLSVNPYLLEYFALARGYGLSVGLMTASIALLFRYYDDRVHRASAGSSPLRASLLCATAAVMANFAFLNVYVGLVGFVCVAGVLITARATHRPSHAGASQGADAHRRPLSTRTVAAVAIIAAAFNVLVLSQDINLSPALYEPIRVTLTGPAAPELDQVEVSVLDARGRPRLLSRNGAVWRLDPPAHACGLVFDLPSYAVPQLERIETVIGTRTFVYDAKAVVHLAAVDRGDRRTLYGASTTSLEKPVVLSFGHVINWKSDSTYVRVLIGRSVAVGGLLAALAVLLFGIGLIVGRAGLLADAQWRPVVSNVWLTAALAAVPLFILRRNRELVYGGTRGLLDDTFLELVRSAFYGATYHPAQVSIAFGVVALLCVTAIAVILADWRQGHRSQALRTSCVMTLVVAASASAVVQRALFETPYPMGRTALFFLPLWILLFVLVCDGVAVLAGWTRTAVIAACAVTGLFLYHFGSTANLRASFDWPYDADTKQMAADLRMAIQAMYRPGSRVSLGVDWIRYPVARYYVARQTEHVDVEVASPHGQYDFLYLGDRSEAPSGRVVRRYRRSDSVLAKGASRP